MYHQPVLEKLNQVITVKIQEVGDMLTLKMPFLCKIQFTLHTINVIRGLTAIVELT